MDVFTLIALPALAFGGWMGLYSMLKPSWGSKAVGLSATPGNHEGYSEFRATYGGLFFFGHLSALVGLFMFDSLVAPLVCVPLAAGWLGAGLGRMLSITRDADANTRQNWIWVGFEWGMGVLIGLPLLGFL